MFENPRKGRQARNFTTNAPKILDLKSSSEQIFSRKLPLGAPEGLPMHKTDPKHTLLLESKFYFHHCLYVKCKRLYSAHLFIILP